MLLKAELHTHTSDDPVDCIPHDSFALIDRAADLGYRVLAITLHDRQLEARYLRDYAREREIVLLPGVERTLFGKHVLLINFPAAADTVSDFDEIRRLKARSNGIVIAPHPFFPTGTCLGGLLEEHADVFDAVEVNAFFTPTFDFNTRARAWAEAHGRPLVGNCDVHRLHQLGTTYSLIDAEPDADAVCEAIRRGDVQVVANPITLAGAALTFASLFAGDAMNRLRPRRRADPVPTVA